MNKLKELAKKADCTLDGMGYGEGNVEGFAKLIIKECMKLSDELKAEYLKDRMVTTDFDDKAILAEGETACDMLRSKMKDHFGIA